MYHLGILGGMGPEATVELYSRIVKYEEAEKDQDHIDICVLNKSSIPDRTSNIMLGTESPINKLNEGIQELALLGCEYFVLPCNTAHYFANQFIIPENLKFINMIEETLKYIENTYPNHNVCILGTRGTRKGKIYESYPYDVNIIYPDESEQEVIMDVIYEIKGSADKNEIIKALNQVIEGVSSRYENTVFVMACTELSLYTNYFEDVKVVDAMDALVRETVKRCKSIGQ